MESIFQLNSDDEEVESTEKEQNEVENITIKYDQYERFGEHDKNPKTLRLALLSRHHSLWAEYIYNAARVLADLIDGHQIDNIPPIEVRGQKCLELGAGAGLPAVIAALNGASEVVVSDYGHDFDLSLIYPLDINRTIVTSQNPAVPFHAVGYTWGYPVNILIRPEKLYQSNNVLIDTSSYELYQQTKKSARIPEDSLLSSFEGYSDQDKFDLIFAADLLFNRSEHRKLLWTIKQCLKPQTGICYVTFSHHDPAKAPLDLNFFTLAQEEDYQFTVEKIGPEVLSPLLRQPFLSPSLYSRSKN